MTVFTVIKCYYCFYFIGLWYYSLFWLEAVFLLITATCKKRVFWFFFIVPNYTFHPSAHCLSVICFQFIPLSVAFLNKGYIMIVIFRWESIIRPVVFSCLSNLLFCCFSISIIWNQIANSSYLQAISGLFYLKQKQ